MLYHLELKYAFPGCPSLGFYTYPKYSSNPPFYPAQFEGQNASNPPWGIKTTRSAAVAPLHLHPLLNPSSMYSIW